MHVCQTRLVQTHVRLQIVMKRLKRVTHSTGVVTRLMVHARLMMNAGRYTTVVSLEFVLDVMWMVIVALTNAVFFQHVCCSDEDTALSYLQYL